MRKIWFALWVFVVPAARADLNIDITKGVADPVAIAIVPFARSVPADGGLDVAALVQRDLESSGRFRAMARARMLSQPSRVADVRNGDWKAAGNDYVAIGRVVAGNGGQLNVECELVNLLTGQRVGGQRITATSASLRNASHQISDWIYERIVGIRGAFATRIAYVTVDGQLPNRRYQLIVADADGENWRPVLESKLPIMSPAWSPDGQWLAYVSFENRVAGIYVQRVRTGERRLVSARAGVNNAPSYSPDGQKLALTLSGSGGNLDVYVLDLGTQQLTRITDDPSIDTEPSWSVDGRALYFTSDRSGGPQIYKADVASHAVQRVSYSGSYNARPRVSPDGRSLAMVTRDGGDFRIAVQDLASGTQSVLTRGSQDESPSFAPNGATLIYAARQEGRSTLASVSTDGQVSTRISDPNRGAVREPVWGPFAQ